MIWWYIWDFAFQMVVIMAWFVLVFTARWPLELFNFATSFLRYQARLQAWVLLLTDRFPPWIGKPDDDWGLTLEIGAKSRYSRPKTGFRLVLVLPLVALSYGVVFYGAIFAFLAWWAILFTGRLPRWCFQPMADSAAWYQRFVAYRNLLVEDWPPFKGLDPPSDEPQAGQVAAAPPPSPATPQSEPTAPASGPSSQSPGL